MRPSERAHDQLRKVTITRQYTRYAEGSVLICVGHTHVLCTVSVVEGVPRFLKGQKKGWLTAEYGMLPRATHTRGDREACRGKQSGRTQEIQRLIGRSLRQAVDLSALGEYTLQIDCDVLQADGGTRTAAITGSCVALADAIRYMQQQNLVKTDPFKGLIAAVSVGVFDGVAVLDLDYQEDSQAHTDMNVVMTEQGQFIEIQGTAENAPFGQAQCNSLLSLATNGIAQLCQIQRESLA